MSMSAGPAPRKRGGCAVPSGARFGTRRKERRPPELLEAQNLVRGLGKDSLILYSKSQENVPTP